MPNVDILIDPFKSLTNRQSCILLFPQLCELNHDYSNEKSQTTNQAVGVKSSPV